VIDLSRAMARLALGFMLGAQPLAWPGVPILPRLRWLVGGDRATSGNDKASVGLHAWRATIVLA
jgi:hypothetical protein